MDAPEDPPLLRQQAVTLTDLGRGADAVKTARALLTVQPSDAGAQNLLAYALLRQNLDAPQALKLAHQAAAARPDSAEIMDTLGVAQLAMKRENRVKFGPFLALGAVVALLWGHSWIASYRQMLGL